MSKDDRPIRWIRIGDLHVVWPDAQRTIREAKVKEIMAEFDPDFFGIPLVAKAQDEKSRWVYHIIDGQNRIEALRRMWGDDQKIQCQVVSSVQKPAHAAKVFLGTNTNSLPAPLEKFWVQVTEGNKEALGVKAVIDESGFSIGTGGLQAISAARNIYRDSPESLAWVLEALKGTWGLGAAPVQSQIVLGFGRLYREFDGTVDPTRLAKAVSRKYTPHSLLGAAKTSRGVLAGDMADAVMRLVIKVYNLRLSDGKKLTLDAA